MNNIKYIKNKSTYKGVQVKRLYYYNLYYFYVRKTKSNPIFTYSFIIILDLMFCQFCCIAK